MLALRALAAILSFVGISKLWKNSFDNLDFELKNVSWKEIGGNFSQW